MQIYESGLPEILMKYPTHHKYFLDYRCLHTTCLSYILGEDLIMYKNIKSLKDK